MARFIAVALMSLIVAGTEPLFAKDYILKLELKTDIETKVGNEMSSKKSDFRTIEVLVAPEHRFQGKTTWNKESLSAKGKLTETKDGKLEIKIACRHSSKVTPSGQPDRDDPQPEIENCTRTETTIGMMPGQTVILGGMATSETTETPNGIRETNRRTQFRLTLIEDEPEDDSAE